MNSLLLALQFFTTVPIKKNLPMDAKHINGMYLLFPFIGAGIGAIAYMMLYFEWSSLMTAFAIVCTGIVLSGGLHMDGYTDTADAFFSYRDRGKRLEILEDPRVGAFGVIAVVLLIGGKIIILSEVLAAEDFHWLYIIIIPFLSRVVMVLLFTLTPNAKDSGLAHFFKQKMQSRLVLTVTLIVQAIGIFLVASVNWIIAILILLVLLLFIVVYRKWSIKNFGGLTGDLLGATIELAEVVLWIVLLLSLS